MEFYKLYFCIALLFLMYTYKYCNDRKYSYNFVKKLFLSSRKNAIMCELLISFNKLRRGKLC